MRSLLVYGLICGAVIGGVLLLRVSMFDTGHMFNSRVAGYAVMIAAFALIFVAVKRYRDEERGGVISFKRAFGAGALVAVLASLVYAGVWELYSMATGGAWMEGYTASLIADIRSGELSHAERAARIAQIEQMAEMYQNFWFRFPVTLSEILPLGVLVALASAGLLRTQGGRRRAEP